MTAAKEPIINKDGNPRLVVAGGRLVGVRAADGSVITLPERRPEDDLPDQEWTWLGGVPRERD
jgi:hypothetical protein